MSRRIWPWRNYPFQSQPVARHSMLFSIKCAFQMQTNPPRAHTPTSPIRLSQSELLFPSPHYLWARYHITRDSPYGPGPTEINHLFTKLIPLTRFSIWGWFHPNSSPPPINVLFASTSQSWFLQLRTLTSLQILECPPHTLPEASLAPQEPLLIGALHTPLQVYRINSMLSKFFICISLPSIPFLIY